MLSHHSPDKENRSPQTRRRDKTSKEIKTPHELLQVLAVNHISMTKELTSQIMQLSHPHPPHEKEIKLFAGKQDDDTHLLKVKLADYEFELKKMGEDFAEFQLLAKMDRDKHVRRLREELDFEKSKNVEDNCKWEKKFAERQAQYDRDCQAYHAKVEEEGRRTIAESTARLNGKHEQAIHRLKSTHDETVRQLHRTIQELKHDLEHRVRQEREAHHKDVQNIKKTHETVLKEKEEQFETKIISVESEKKAEIKATEETKKESSKIQEKYLHQIGTIQREKRRLEQKFDEMDMKCKVLHKRLEDRNKELEQLRQTHSDQLEKVQEERKNAVQNARTTFNLEKIQFLRDEYSRTEQIQLKLMKLDEVKEQMSSSYDGLLRTLQTRFQRRESKRQDIQALREYEQRLVSKQRENSQIYQQLRMVQLEKENNDKIYTRIFTSNKKDKKSLSHKDANDIHALFKQSQTTDFRHLLKLAHK